MKTLKKAEDNFANIFHQEKFLSVLDEKNTDIINVTLK